MTGGKAFSVDPGMKIGLHDLGISVANVLQRAGLPKDLLERANATLSTPECFRLWEGLEAEAADPLLPIRISSAISTEAFSPPIFAALCSPDLNTGLSRLAKYKRLVCPMALHVEVGRNATTLEVEWLDKSVEPPASLVIGELAFFVQLARIATRTKLCPSKICVPQVPEAQDEYAEYFGVRVQRGSRPIVEFKAADATLPFLTANAEMWKTFEPHLQKRLSELNGSASTADRVRAVLLEVLPTGVASIEAVSRQLSTSVRTLQRRLKQEKKSFQEVLDKTREDLARQYLKNENLTGSEISFLLGYEDPSSFCRAFQAWTGKTPLQVRAAVQVRH